MKLFYEELTGKIISAAIAVHRELKPRLDEKIYERALCIELAEQGIGFEQQPRYDVLYKGRYLGHLTPDLVVENKIIVDPKCVDSFSLANEAQMLGYLNITGLSVALLLNFKAWPLGKKRILHPNIKNTQP